MAPLSLHAQNTVLYGDVDGFGFPTVTGLVDATGNPADRNSNGVLDEGDSLPDLNMDGSVSPSNTDAFDNATGGDPAGTDAGVVLSSDLLMPFTFAVPPGTTVLAGTLEIVVGDASLADVDEHRIFVDGIDTGAVLEPRMAGSMGDGLVTVTEVDLTGATLAALQDGQALVSVTYDSTFADDIALDYARLTLQTAERVPALSTLSLVLLGLGTVGSGAFRLRRSKRGRADR